MAFVQLRRIEPAAFWQPQSPRVTKSIEYCSIGCSYARSCGKNSAIMSAITASISKPQSSSHRAVALLKYRPKCDDELCLTTGQAVQVLSIDPKVSGSEGWWVGQDSYGKVGVFPANYVQLQVASPESDDNRLQSYCNLSEGHNSSLRDSSCSFPMDGTLVPNRVPTPLLLTDSVRGTGDGDGDFRIRQNGKVDDLKESLSHLRVIKFEDIKLGESIGAGSFGTVYRGTWQEKTVALKVYHQASSQIQREAFNLGQLAHRNVVEFFGLWETQETISHLPALVMEFAHGGALHTDVRRRPTIRPLTLADWALQIAEGMRYLHECAGLVHRDLKTANILIREPLVASPGPDDLIRKTLIISDFGMSCPTDIIDSCVSGIGTAAYAAPEVICMAIFSLASDVWSYGVVLWEIFTMLEPFQEFDRAQQLVNIGRYRQKLFIPRPEAGFPEVIGTLLTSCWADERTDRPTFCDIYNRIMDAQHDSFFSLSTEEFTALQSAWIREISDEAELSLLSESCSSEASSPLRRQNEYLQQENAKMRDALQTLQQNEVRYRGTIAGLQKDNQILSVLVANTLYNNAAPLAAPAPRKRPFIYNPFRRNEQKTSAVNLASVLSGEGESPSATTTAAVGAGVVTTTECSPRDYSPAVKSTGRRYGGRKTSKSGPGISYPSDVRHVFHVPCNLVFESNNELYSPIYRSNFSPGSYNTFVGPSIPSPTSPTIYASGSASSSYLRPRTDSQSTDPPVHPSSIVFSPTEDAADIARHFAFLYAQNGLTGTTPLLTQITSQTLQQKHQRFPKFSGTGGLTSYKSAPELCEKIRCSKARLNTLEGRHTVSRSSAFDPTDTPADRKPTTSSTSGANGSVNTSKRHRIGLSALFHTSRSKHNSGSGKPPSPACESIPLSPLPPSVPTTASDLSPSSTLSGTASQSGRGSGKRKSLSTTPRRLLLHKLFQTERNRQRRVSAGSRKSSGLTKKQRDSVSPDSSQILPEGTVQSSPDLENRKVVIEPPHCNYVSATVQIPPLPPYLLRQSNHTLGPRRRLLDIIPPPPAHLPTTAASIPRPCTLSATSDGETKSGVRRRPFVLRIKSQSLDILYQPDEAMAMEAKGEESNETEAEGEDDEGEETGGVASMNPVPLALWSALHVASIAPLFLDCNPAAPVRSYPPTAPHSASFARVTFSPFTTDESNHAAGVLGKAQSCLGRISSTLALTTVSVDRSRQPTRQQWNTQRELSAPAPSSSPWQRKLNNLSPVYYSPPSGSGVGRGDGSSGGGGGSGQEPCCKCVCHSAGGGSRQSSSATTTTTSSQSSSPWLPVDNPVALSRDAYLKVTQDGYLNRSAVGEALDDDDDDDGIDMTSGMRSTSSVLLSRSLCGFSPSPLFSPTSFLQQQQQQRHPSNSPPTSFLDSSGVAVDPGDQVIILPEEEEEETGELSFGAGEAAEDTDTLYAEFQTLPHQALYKTVYDGKLDGDWCNGCAPIPEPEVLSTEFPSYPCRRRKAFRMKDKPEGLLSSPEDDSANGTGGNPTIPAAP
uniref:mitogen-activated protein kinase kinase kinase n=1 Tax=Echinococcus granulosus TaxID=6210 RepID=A0A068WKS7_ECHGR|nr:mitogen-activated protein kinase kinase kinase 9 [Echinococcus granulosus]